MAVAALPHQTSAPPASVARVKERAVACGCPSSQLVAECVLGGPSVPLPRPERNRIGLQLASTWHLGGFAGYSDDQNIGRCCTTSLLKCWLEVTARAVNVNVCVVMACLQLYLDMCLERTTGAQPHQAPSPRKR